jgi:multiple sugar transport system substrate-binding protein
MRIWVPPQFDPHAGTLAAVLFQERLDEFAADHSDLQIEVRVKAESGTGSLLNALAATKLAAPSIMPDLVALSRPDLESAAEKGLLHHLDGLTNLAEEADWYPYARQMAHIQDATFGLPFAGDALVLVGYRAPLPSNWTELPEETLLIFPAADPEALFTISLYLSAGGALQNNQGQIALDEATLAKVLSLYAPEAENNLVSPQVTNYETSQQAWDAFRELRGNLVVSWTARFLNEKNISVAMAPLPGLEEGQYCLARGWSWTLAGSNPENEELAMELAEFLSDNQFLAKWTQAAGYLPTRSTALSAWDDVKHQLTLKQIAESAVMIPQEDVLLIVGPLFKQAVLSVLNGEQLPEEAARLVMEQLD